MLLSHFLRVDGNEDGEFAMTRCVYISWSRKAPSSSTIQQLLPTVQYSQASQLE
jgi:hypothetical protein